MVQFIPNLILAGKKFGTYLMWKKNRIEKLSKDEPYKLYSDNNVYVFNHKITKQDARIIAQLTSIK